MEAYQMKKFKTATGISSIYQISDANYELQTGKKSPYRQNKNNSISYYAVCPECENPIQMVGIFKATEETEDKTYGRHHKGTIPALATYDEDDYINCSLSSPKRKKSEKLRSPTSKVANQTLTILKTQFDRVIYLISKQMSVKISSSLAEKMLKQYLAEEGWLHREATLNNIPWLFVQCNPAIPLFGRYIVKDSELHQEIVKHCPDVDCIGSNGDEYVQIRQANKSYVRLYFTLCNYRKKVEDEHLIETIDFLLYEDTPYGKELKTIFSKEIVMQTDYFNNLIQDNRKNDYRNQALLDVSNKLINFKAATD